MNKSIETKSRKFEFSFSKDLDSKQSEALQQAISHLQDSSKLVTQKRQFVLEYEFPLTSITEIRPLINKLMDASLISYVDKLRFSLRCFAEQNEREHQLYSRYWHTYVEDIYVHYFDYEKNSDNDVRNQLWRRYRKNRK